MVERIPMQKGDFGYHDGSTIQQYKYRLVCDICGEPLMLRTGKRHTPTKIVESTNNIEPLFHAHKENWICEDTGFAICHKCLKLS